MMNNVKEKGFFNLRHEMYVHISITIACVKRVILCL
jgi:hypothetical protein